MSHAFNPRHGPIMVEAEVTGPALSMPVRLILDTGATTSLLAETVLRSLGYDLANAKDHAQMTTGSIVQTVPKVVLTRVTALDHHRFGFAVLAYSFPASPSVYGLLGLDFLRDRTLTIDFRAGQIVLA